MKLRLAAPALLIDMRKIPGLHGIQRENGNWRIGAMTPHVMLETTPELGDLSTAAAYDRRPPGSQPGDDRREPGAR